MQFRLTHRQADRCTLLHYALIKFAGHSWTSLYTGISGMNPTRLVATALRQRMFLRVRSIPKSRRMYISTNSRSHAFRPTVNRSISFCSGRPVR